MLWEADFNPKVRTYWLLSGALILTVTVAGIPLLPFWFLLGHYFTARYLSHMRCRLTPKSLEVAKGMFVRVEKTVPLDKITDVGLLHGPIMRHFDLRALSVETAGQSSAGALIKLVGIEDTEGFRAAVLAQRDKMVESLEGASPQALPPGGQQNAQYDVLVAIRDSLERIETKLGEGD
ncbi:MAG: PH domain-containing protein [Gemmatimonadetes bacterium]|nr:PH domain-containing protein [Gemmatimonadota bacterium]NNM32313.1 PH domain-containing protein [Gemmatimonadota bacterium]